MKTKLYIHPTNLRQGSDKVPVMLKKNFKALNVNLSTVQPKITKWKGKLEYGTPINPSKRGLGHL